MLSTDLVGNLVKRTDSTRFDIRDARSQIVERGLMLREKIQGFVENGFGIAESPGRKLCVDFLLDIDR